MREIISVFTKRVKRLFSTPPDHMNVVDKLRLRFMDDKRLNHYSIFGKEVEFPFHPYWFRHSYKEIFEEEVYKFPAATSSPLIIDCGSNIGLSLIYFCKNYPRARIISFEPDKNIFQTLKKNVSVFNFSNSIEFKNQAVWTENTSLRFFATGGMGGSVQTQSSESKEVMNVEAVRLKELLTQKVDLLKIDIEGPEVMVIQDCMPVLNNVENIFVEYHCGKGEEQKLDHLLAMLSASGFRYYIRQAYENMRYPFIQKHGEFMDIQLNIFCFRSNSVVN
jgi:FkbM family methyltransferase